MSDREIRRNGSPLPIFETDERNMHFMATLPIHRIFLDEDGNVVESVVEKLTERQKNILDIIKNSVVESVVETAESLAKKVRVSPRTVQRELKLLQEHNRLKRKGADYGGQWEVIEDD